MSMFPLGEELTCFMHHFGLLATEEEIRVNNSIPAAAVDEKGETDTEQQTEQQQQQIIHSSSRYSTAGSEWSCMMECPLSYQSWRTFKIKKTK